MIAKQLANHTSVAQGAVKTSLKLKLILPMMMMKVWTKKASTRKMRKRSLVVSVVSKNTLACPPARLRAIANRTIQPLRQCYMKTRAECSFNATPVKSGSTAAVLESWMKPTVLKSITANTVGKICTQLQVQRQGEVDNSFQYLYY